jgi:CheY-like chemotaxis protein
MLSVDAAVARLPIVLVVDPVAASRLAMWRLLSPSFGVIEAPDARRAQESLTRRPDIAALVMQKELPDADGAEFVKSLVVARAAIASRAILVGRPVDSRAVLTSLAGWFFSRDIRKAGAVLREADRLVS